MKNKKQIISLILCISLIAAAFSACASSPEKENSAESSIPSSSADVSKTQSSDSHESSEVSDSTSIPPLNDPTPDAEGTFYDGVYVYNNAAFEMFYGGEEAAKNYAQTLSNIKKSLGDGIIVYNVVVPTHCEVNLPERFSDLSYSQREYLDNLFGSYTEDIIAVDPYYSLMQHRNEYLYFNTDHHWTADGAYLAYCSFAEKAGITPLSGDDMEKRSIEGFVGSLANMISAPELDGVSDTVYYYAFKNSVSATQYDENGENPVESILLHEYAEGVNAYGVFLGGDFPLIVSENESGNGKKIAIVKESYGNAFAPFIAATYSETHIIDSRYFSKNLNTYLEENQIDTVIFINNTMASATPVRCEELAALVN